MKLIFTSLILILLLSCHKNAVKGSGSVSTEDAATSSKFRARRDSIIEVTEFGSIYLSRDTSSMIYDALAPDLRYLDQPGLKEYITKITGDYGVKVGHFKIHDLKSAWSTLYWFNGDYCLYGHSDWMANAPIFLSDSVYYEPRSDPWLKVILDYKFISKTKHQFKLIDYDGDIRLLEIEIIDPTRGIAIWISRDITGEINGKSLMVQSEKVRYFPILVYDCGGDKCVFESEGTHFKTPDFLK